jgi:type II secretory pathway component GspD/PulD (secretin)
VDHEDMEKSLILFSVIFSVCFLATVCAAAQTAAGDEPVSLNFEEQPLSEVLAMITKITGHAFIIDAQWLDMPVSISVEATPLHKALKYIFTDMNNAIIYRSDGKIKIIVYSENPENDKGSVSQRITSSEESASSPATEQESESSQEAAPEDETGNSVDSTEEGGAQPAEEQASTDEKTDDTAAGTAEEPGESTEGVTN